MEATAISKYARYSPRKVGQVLDLVRGRSIESAYRVLPTVPRASAIVVFKTIKSAYSNLGAGDPSQVFVKRAWVDTGPTLKRIRAMAMGGRGIYKRKMCHVNIVVTDEKPKKRS